MSQSPANRERDATRREALLRRIERLTELPLLILAFIVIPLIVGPLLWTLTPEEEETFATLALFVWALFAADLAAKVTVAPFRLRYLREHWLEVLIVAVPFLRPLRIVQVFIFGARAVASRRRLTQPDFLFVYVIGMVVIAATAVTTAERELDGTITSFPDAIWRAVATVTTVGYGDVVPATALGRAIAIILMIGGIGFFSGLAANFAAFLVRQDDPDQDRLARLTTELEGLRQEVSRLTSLATNGGASTRE